MEEIRKIQIADFDYNLPEQLIARYPLDRREQSKLLLHINGKIGQDQFFNIGNYLLDNTLIVSNETRVIRARLQFKKESGTTIELFCLEPEVAIADFQLAFGSSSPVVWKCLVGNSKRWKSGVLQTEIELEGTKVRFSALRLTQHSDHSMVQFSWDAPSFSFGQILEAAGEIPLPPYLNRKAEVLDQTRYQTVFARFEGSVAAPTAGLHFTLDVINDLINKGMQFEKVILHVGAGTFKPVSTAQIGDHEMHSERIIVNRETIVALLNSNEKNIIAVGTTSMRTLESLYWLGVKIGAQSEGLELHLDQWYPYNCATESQLDKKVALQNIINFLDINQLSAIEASTALMIAPGYKFRIVNGLITNFHQPKSTLLLLVSALIGDKWKEAYQFALENNFRFLSYGDSCLFLP